MTNLEIAVTSILTFAGFCLALFIIMRIIRLAVILHQELRYINMEIKRTTGKERDYWLEKRRKLLRDCLTGHK